MARCDLLPRERDWLAYAADVMDRRTPAGRFALFKKLRDGLNTQHFVPKSLPVTDEQLDPNYYAALGEDFYGKHETSTDSVPSGKTPGLTEQQDFGGHQRIRDRHTLAMRQRHPEDFWAPLPIFVSLGPVIKAPS
ncbi:unnamed protein product [Amoebophrya sp. A25]|nr:unnamed protein product [Amoebophrya sp. A25]|eukprot:GSA25T00012666001.1